MALSQKTKDTLVVAMANKDVASDIIAKIESHDTESGDPDLLAAWEAAQATADEAAIAADTAQQNVTNASANAAIAGDNADQAEAAMNAAEQTYLDALAADPEDPNLPALLTAYENAQDTNTEAQNAYIGAQDMVIQAQQALAIADANLQGALQASDDAQAAYEASVAPGNGVISEASKKVLIVAMADVKAAEEFASAINTGAALSLETKRRIIICMASSDAGNELINEVQTVKTAPISL